MLYIFLFFFSSRRRHTRCALVTGVQTCALPICTGGQIMVVNPDSPAKTVKDFIKLAKENPGKLSFGSGSSSSRVAGELFQQMEIGRASCRERVCQYV